MVHVDQGWLLLSPIVYHSLLILYLTLNFFPLFFFFNLLFCVLFCFLQLCLFILYSVSFRFLLFLLLFSCLGLREEGGLGAVCLKPSRVDLLRPSTVKKRLYTPLSFFFFSFFFLTQDPLVEKSGFLLCFAFLP